MRRSTRRSASLPPCSHGGPIEAFELEGSADAALDLPPCSHGGPIEAVMPARLRPPVVSSFRRVHTAAPLKRRVVRLVSREGLRLPPCSHGGPIEASSLRRRTSSGGSLPPCSHGGPIEARSTTNTRQDASPLPPCSHGGPIEATKAAHRLARQNTAFRRVHTAAPLKPGSVARSSSFIFAFRRVHTAAPLKRVQKGEGGQESLPSAVFTRRPH